MRVDSHLPHGAKKLSDYLCTPVLRQCTPMNVSMSDVLNIDEFISRRASRTLARTPFRIIVPQASPSPQLR